MALWEYRIVARTCEGMPGSYSFTWGHDQKDKRSGQHLLNDLGGEGWELVTIACMPHDLRGTEMHYAFKRPKA